MGGAGRGGRTKSWAPVALASAHPAERALYMYRFPPCADRRPPPHFPLYVVPRFPPAPTAGTPAQFSPSAAPLTVSTCLRAAVGKVPPHRRTPDAPRLCSRLHRWATPRGKSDGGEVGGAGRGRSNKIVGPSCPRFGSSRGASVVYVPIPTLRRPPTAAAFSVVRCTAIPTCADRGNASAVLSVCCSPHRQHLPAGRGWKSSATPPHPRCTSALLSSPPLGHPTGEI